MTSNVIQQPKPRPVIFSLLTLLSGIVIGAGATLIFVGPKQKDTPPPLPEEVSRRMIEHLTRELALTEEQQEKIKPVVETHMQILDELRDKARPEIRQEVDTMNNEILALLDENQQQMWKDSIERMQQRFREFRQRRGPGNDGQRRRDGERRGGDRLRRGDGPDNDPNSPSLRRQLSPDDMDPGMMPPPPNDPFRPDRRRLRRPRDPNQPPQEVQI
ncbi:MAG: hypothetical protein ISS71_03385 [Phycisphaerae bacterium]|nr:hypothetical protein [Phycisphaerae bacterium]